MSQALISPTVGRVVWFYPSRLTGEAGFAPASGTNPLAAVIAHVWSESLVNLAVFDANGKTHSRTSVKLIHKEIEGDWPAEDFCTWMPFQKGQAKAQSVGSRYRKKPVVITAITFDELVQHGIAAGGNIVNGMPWSFTYAGQAISHENNDCYLIPTLEGVMKMGRTDMLITGVKGEIYPCKADVFAATYDLA